MRYLGPKVRIIRRLGLLPGFTRKIPLYSDALPGQHGAKFLFKNKSKAVRNDYRRSLKEKQRLRFNYGITDHKLFSYYKEAKKSPNSTAFTLLELIEKRLDCIVHRLGFAPTIPAARQLITHGHFIVNSKKVNIPSFLCKIGDYISIKKKSKSYPLIYKTFKLIKKKRKVISKLLISYPQKFFRYHFIDALPSHLEVNSKTLIGKFISPIKRYDISIRINEFKVLQYYSR
jgi:small subunit ribosomal protein S4